MPVGIIPARGGSKSIPRKNLRKIHGETLIARCVRICLEADEGPVVVTTEDDEIAVAASRAGATVVIRPDDLATDEASTWDVVRHATKQCLSRTFYLAQCTAPLMTSGDVKRCCEAMYQGDMAVCVHEAHPWQLSAGGEPLFDTPPKRRQDIAPTYEISGSVWAFRAEYLEQDQYSGKLIPVPSEHPIRCDIDKWCDLELAEAVVPREQGWTSTIGME